MKYRLSYLIGCIAVLLGVFSLTSCNDKDKKDNGIESGYSIVGTWTHSEYDPEYGLTTVTIQFNEDQTGSYTYANATETEVQNIMYTYDPTTCTGTVLIFNNHGSEESDFKIKWYDENTVTVSTYDDYSGTWESKGTFTRKTNGGGGGGTNPSGDTYSIIGSWKHYENGKEGPHTEIVQFNADGTGSVMVTGNEGTTIYSLSYTYSQGACAGNSVMTYTEPGGEEYYYYIDFKVKWYGPNNIVMSTKMSDDPLEDPATEWTDTAYERL